MPRCLGLNQYSVMSDAREEEIDGRDDAVALLLQIGDRRFQFHGRYRSEIGRGNDVFLSLDRDLRKQSLKKLNSLRRDEGGDDARCNMPESIGLKNDEVGMKLAGLRVWIRIDIELASHSNSPA